MREKTLLKTAIGCSVLGIIVLFFVSSNIDIQDYKPSELSKDIGKDVKLKGIVTGVQNKGSFTSIQLTNEYTTQIVVFTKENSTIIKGDTIEIFGEVQEYNDKPEIIARKIRVIS